MKTVNLPLDVAKAMFKSDTSCLDILKTFALANYTKEELEAKELPKTWEDLKIIEGHYINTETNILYPRRNRPDAYTKCVFATEEQAKASLALAQLSQLIQIYNDGWKPNWEEYIYKYCLRFSGNQILHYSSYTNHYFLTFKTKELSELFLKNFRCLIEQAKPLL